MITTPRRYNALLKRNYNTRANSPISERGYSYPTPRQMSAFEKYNIPPDVDPILRDIVIELNNKGYRTNGSCQGHLSKRNAFIGIELFKPEWLKYIPNTSPTEHIELRNLMMKASRFSLIPINPSEIIRMMKKYGLTDIKYEPPQMSPKNLDLSNAVRKKEIIPQRRDIPKLASPSHVFRFKAIPDEVTR